MPTNNAISLQLSRKAIEAIIFEEVTSVEYYNKVHTRPSWPGGESGITIGIGYDLGYNTRAQIIADWRGRIAEADLEILLACSGKKAEAAADIAKLPRIRSINVPYTEAYKVFVSRTLPRFTAMTQAIYPGLAGLKPDAIGALVSMVYNRGNDLKGPRRKEMKAIVPLVAAKDYKGIADQVRASKRLWIGKGLDGLLRRRDNEAVLIEHANREYKPEELLTITINA